MLTVKNETTIQKIVDDFLKDYVNKNQAETK